jgi:flagellin
MSITSISTNQAALVAQLNIGKANSAVTANVTALSDGSRIVSASTDVAALSTGTTLQNQVNVLNAAKSVASQGSSLLQVADGGLTQIQSILQRQQSIATSAQSGSLSDTQRGFLDQEFQNLTDQLDQLAKNTNFNGVKLLDGSLSQSLTSTTSTAAATKASASVTIGTNAVAGDQIKINGSTFTFGSSTGQIAVGSDINATTANLVTFINTAASNSGLTATQKSALSAVSATQVGTSGTIDISARNGGKSGQSITVNTASATTAVSSNSSGAIALSDNTTNLLTAIVNSGNAITATATYTDTSVTITIGGLSTGATQSGTGINSTLRTALASIAGASGNATVATTNDTTAGTQTVTISNLASVGGRGASTALTGLGAIATGTAIVNKTTTGVFAFSSTGGNLGTTQSINSIAVANTSTALTSAASGGFTYGGNITYSGTTGSSTALVDSSGSAISITNTTTLQSLTAQINSGTSTSGVSAYITGATGNYTLNLSSSNSSGGTAATATNSTALSLGGTGYLTNTTPATGLGSATGPILATAASSGSQTVTFGGISSASTVLTEGNSGLSSGQLTINKINRTDTSGAINAATTIAGLATAIGAIATTNGSGITAVATAATNSTIVISGLGTGSGLTASSLNGLSLAYTLGDVTDGTQTITFTGTALTSQALTGLTATSASVNTKTDVTLTTSGVTLGTTTLTSLAADINANTSAGNTTGISAAITTNASGAQVLTLSGLTTTGTGVGASGLVGGNANVTVGALANFKQDAQTLGNFTTGDSIEGLADRINANAAATGVKAATVAATSINTASIAATDTLAALTTALDNLAGVTATATAGTGTGSAASYIITIAGLGSGSGLAANALSGFSTAGITPTIGTAANGTQTLTFTGTGAGATTVLTGISTAVRAVTTVATGITLTGLGSGTGIASGALGSGVTIGTASGGSQTINFNGKTAIADTLSGVTYDFGDFTADTKAARTVSGTFSIGAATASTTVALANGGTSGLGYGSTKAVGSILDDVLTAQNQQAASSRIVFPSIQSGDLNSSSYFGSSTNFTIGSGSAATTFTFSTNADSASATEIQVGSNLQETLANAAAKVNTFRGTGTQNYVFDQIKATSDGTSISISGKTANTIYQNDQSTAVTITSSGSSSAVTNASLNNSTSGGVDVSTISNAAFTGTIDGITATTNGTANQVNLSVKIGDITYAASNVSTNALANTKVQLVSTDTSGKGGYLTIELQALNGENVANQADADKFAARLNTALSGLSFFQTRDVSSFDPAKSGSSIIANGQSIGSLNGSSISVTSDNFDNFKFTGVTVSPPLGSNTVGQITFAANGQNYVSVSSVGTKLAANTSYTFTSTSNPNQSITFTTGSTAIDFSSTDKSQAVQAAITSAFGSSGAAISFQVGSDSTQSIGVSIGSATSSSLFQGQTLDVKTLATATNAANVITDALNTVTSLRATVGALEGRFNYASSAIESAVQNQGAARSNLLDTDVASTSTEFSTSQVQLQAGIAVLAQANQLQQQLTKLIQ